MKGSDAWIFLLYGIVFLVFLYLVMIMIGSINQGQPNVIVVEERPRWRNEWPWTGTYYNWWPQWAPWSYGGGRRWGPVHGHKPPGPLMPSPPPGPAPGPAPVPPPPAPIPTPTPAPTPAPAPAPTPAPTPAPSPTP